MFVFLFCMFCYLCSVFCVHVSCSGSPHVSFLFVYEFTDQCHRLEAQLQLIWYDILSNGGKSMRMRHEISAEPVILFAPTWLSSVWHLVRVLGHMSPAGQ
jgi:hypothetical protein